MGFFWCPLGLSRLLCRLWLCAYLVTVTVNSLTIPWVLTVKGIIKEIFGVVADVCVTPAGPGWRPLWNLFLKLGAGNEQRKKCTYPCLPGIHILEEKQTLDKSRPLWWMKPKNRGWMPQESVSFPCFPLLHCLLSQYGACYLLFSSVTLCEHICFSK